MLELKNITKVYGKKAALQDVSVAFAPGQTVEDLFREREALYRQWATYRVAAGDIDVSETANAVFDAIAGCGQAL